MKLAHIMLSALAVGLWAASLPGHTSDSLPNGFEGTWEASAPGGRPPVTGTARIVITKKNADGTFEGNMDYLQGVYCEMKQAPISGRYDGAQLEFIGSFTDKRPNSNCYKDTRFVLKRSGSSFEGKAVNITDISVTLRLRAQGN